MSRPHARFRLASALTLLALSGLGIAAAASPALADPSVSAPPAPTPPAPADALTPLVDCVQDAPLGTVAARTVVLGYRSTASVPISLPAGGGSNDLTGGTADRGQPATFGPGEHHGVWLLTLDAAAEPTLGWRLGATTTDFAAAPACTAATAVTLSTPTKVAAGGTAAVSATVTRMLLAAPGSGSVAFSLDGGTPVVAPVSATGVARADIPVTAAGTHSLTATFQPEQSSGLLSAVGTATFTATAPSAPLTVATDSVVAGSTSVLVTVARASGAGDATVDVMTADGTARAGADYTALATTVALADGQTTATVRVPLASRPAGSPAATFFVLLQRASTSVTTASATVMLPAVAAVAPATAAAAGTHGGGSTPAAASSVLPPDDPTAAGPGATMAAGEDLAVLFGGILLTAGGILGVLGLVRAAGMREARA
ncbi:Calx-beta domain-containing protein [Leifsonia sp. NPDC014704]|uniref:Calx-beta domain-containing protein n=1 Tax=Leifsonia sp. NPDC014704 TaxID=3364123 RepID=UPI0036F47045